MFRIYLVALWCLYVFETYDLTNGFKYIYIPAHLINISITTHCISYTDIVMMKLDHTQHEKKRLYKNDYSRNEERISYSLLVGGSGLQ